MKPQKFLAKANRKWAKFNGIFTLERKFSCASQAIWLVCGKSQCRRSSLSIHWQARMTNRRRNSSTQLSHPADILVKRHPTSCGSAVVTVHGMPSTVTLLLSSESQVSDGEGERKKKTTPTGLQKELRMCKAVAYLQEVWGEAGLCHINTQNTSQ